MAKERQTNMTTTSRRPKRDRARTRRRTKWDALRPMLAFERLAEPKARSKPKPRPPVSLDDLAAAGSASRNYRANAKLLKASEPSKNSQCQKTSSFLIKPRTAPSIAPSQFGDGPLKRHHKLVGPAQICINVLLAEHLFPLLKTFLKQFAINH